MVILNDILQQYSALFCSWLPYSFRLVMWGTASKLTFIVTKKKNLISGCYLLIAYEQSTYNKFRN